MKVLFDCFVCFFHFLVYYLCSEILGISFYYTVIIVWHYEPNYLGLNDNWSGDVCIPLKHECALTTLSLKQHPRSSHDDFVTPVGPHIFRSVGFVVHFFDCTWNYKNSNWPRIKKSKLKIVYISVLFAVAPHQYSGCVWKIKPRAICANL